VVVLGDKDAPDIHSIGQFIREGMRGSQLMTLRDVGQTLVMEKPDEFNLLIERFLEP
jgi:hypothetical protein